MSNFVALGSAVVALIAVLVAIWQIRENARGIRRSNSLPVIATTFNEFRSSEFQDHLRRVWYNAPSSVPENGFQALEYEWRQSAYIVTYFFETLGLLVAYDLVPKDFVVDFSANMIGRSWRALDPFIQAERAFRRRTSARGVSAGFVSHFEHLVALTMDEHGDPVDGEIHKQVRLRQLDD